MVWETRKILGDDEIAINPTAVRIPTFFGHSEAIHIETGSKISAAEVCNLLQAAPGVELMDGTDTGGLPDCRHGVGGEAILSTSGGSAKTSVIHSVSTSGSWLTTYVRALL